MSFVEATPLTTNQIKNLISVANVRTASFEEEEMTTLTLPAGKEMRIFVPLVYKRIHISINIFTERNKAHSNFNKTAFLIAKNNTAACSFEGSPGSRTPVWICELLRTCTFVILESWAMPFTRLNLQPLVHAGTIEMMVAKVNPELKTILIRKQAYTTFLQRRNSS